MKVRSLNNDQGEGDMLVEERGTDGTEVRSECVKESSADRVLLMQRGS